MRSIKRVSLILSLLLLSTAAQGNVVQTERDLYEECSAYSQAGMKDCLAKKANESQKFLQQVENDVAAMLIKWDEDDKYIHASRAAFAVSNKEFAKYREAQCEFSASLSGGGAGNVHEMGHLACVTELNSRRAEQLRNAIIDLPTK